MRNIYIIRKVNFVHNDLENVRVNLGDVVGVFDDHKQAYEAYLTCEKHQHQQTYITNFELTQGKGLLRRMQGFFQKRFPHKDTSNFKEITQIPVLPVEANLIQTEEFIKLSGLRHYDLSVHQQMPQYFKIKMAEDFWGEEDIFPFTVFPMEISALYALQESERNAVEEASCVALNYLWQDMLEQTNANFIGLQGTYTDLSKTPDILENYLQNCTYFSYDEQQRKIYLKLEGTETEDTEKLLKEMTNLFDLLMLKPFSITQINLEVIELASWRV